MSVATRGERWPGTVSDDLPAHPARPGTMVTDRPRRDAGGPGVPASELKPGRVMARGWTVATVTHYVGRDGRAMTSATGTMPGTGERFTLCVPTSRKVQVR